MTVNMHQAKIQEAAKDGAKDGMTPMMAQYTEIKMANPDSLLFYRMGDFYELFFEDAEMASRALGIQLTKRGKHLGEDIPMAGVPVHTADDYLQRLIRLGFRVAVCEQTEDPAEAKKRGAKSVVRRDVVRLVTPGTLTEDSLLDSARNNFLTAISFGSGQFGSGKSGSGKSGSGKSEGELYAFASIDISTGEFLISEVSAKDVPGEIIRLSPSEIIVADKWIRDSSLVSAADQAGTPLTPVPSAYFDSLSGERDLKAALNVSVLEGFGIFSRPELAAVGAILKYIHLTQIGKKPALRMPKKQGPQSVLVIDAATRINLELTKTSKGEKRGSLLDTMDRTVTGPGARELAARLSSPLMDVAEINARLDGVDFLLSESSLRAGLRKSLRGCPDLARAFSRLALHRGGPKDLGVIRDALHSAVNIYDQIKNTPTLAGLPKLLQGFLEKLAKAKGPLALHLHHALSDELPFLKRDGGFIKTGYSADLDQARLMRDESRQILAALQTRYVEETGIKSLKVRHNNMFGFFVEVTAANAKPLLQEPLNKTFIHRQSLANAVRFTTEELVETETRITSAADRALAIEHDIFTELQTEIAANEEALAEIAESLAGMDVFCALAEVAEEQNYVRPVVDDGMTFAITGGRHPVVDLALQKKKEGPFIENDCCLGAPEDQEGDDKSDQTCAAGRIWIVTGPNMAGKSTFLRQNALIALLAQMGSFVPAKAAHIGVVDRLFSRVGASDDLARGRSTFMVEMVETAAILNQATSRSLVILDEIGRGTATFDGLSIAWATVEYLHGVNQCRALFATHYHELTALGHKLDHTANVTMQVKEWKDEIVFLHKVIAGAADRSYGIQVAKLAGLPSPVILRASEVLKQLEDKDQKPSAQSLIDDLPLFAVTRPKGKAVLSEQDEKFKKAMQDINPDELSPKEALEELYRLKKLVLEG